MPAPAVHLSAWTTAEELEQRRLLSVSFSDNYSTDTSGNYTEAMQNPPPTFVDSWKVNTAMSKLDYSISATPDWNSSVFLLKSSVASTLGLTQYTVSGDLIAPKNYQAGLVLNGDPTNGGFVIGEFDNAQYNGHLVLLRETGGQLLGDEGGTGTPPVYADFGDITSQNGTDVSSDTFHISAAVDLTGANPKFTVSITDTTTGKPLIEPDNTTAVTNVVVTDPDDPSTYGGHLIGWRARYHDNTAVFSVTKLSLQSSQTMADHAPAAPSGLMAAQGAATSVKLTWTNNDATTLNWQIERSTDGTNFTAIATTPNTAANGATATYTDPSAPAPQTVYYRVRAFNSFNGGTLSNPSNVASLAVTLPASGVKATYYNYSFWAANPVDTAFLPTVDYNDPTATVAGDPGKVTNTNGNSVIFTGKVHADTTGSYTFISNTGEDGWLYVNGILVSSDPGIHAQENATAVKPITLTGGKDYDIVFLQSWARYYGQDDQEGAHMLWQTPGSATPVLVPSDHLSPTSDAPAVPSSLAVSGSATAHNVDFSFTDDNTAVVSYQLQRSADGGNTWATLSLIQPGSNGAGGTPASLKISDAGPIPGASYQYRVVAVNYTGTSSPSNVVNATIPALPAGNTPGAEAHLFNAEYWKTGSLANNKTIGSPDDFIAMTGSVDQVFGDEMTIVSPDATPFPDIPRIHANSFSSVFTGKIKTDAAGLYTFVSNSDDDGWLYVNDVLVSADPGGHGQRDATALMPVTLLANTEYDFIFMFNQQGGGDSGMHIEWIEPGGALSAVVPAATATTGGIEQISDVPHQETVDAQGNITDTPTGSAAGSLALSATGSSVKLTWTDQSTSELWFEVQRSTDGTNFSDIGQAPFDTGTFTDPNASGHVYYRVRGVNWDGAGPFSAVADTVIGGGAQDVITGTSGDDAITIKQDADHAHIDWTLGAQSGQLPITDPNGLTINGNGGTDTITFDNSNGNPLPNLLKLNQSSGGKFIAQGLQAVGAGQKVDVESSTVQINYSGSSPLSTIQGYLKIGSIFSSTLASNPKFAIADDDSADPLNSGQPANTILLKPAIIGNATLSGKVGFNDFVQLARNYGKTGADWAMGDFNYDAKVDFGDLVALARNYNQSGPAATAALTPAVSADTGTLPKSRRPLSTRL